MPIIVAITGYAGSGKDTFAGALSGRGFVQMEFAKKIKEILSDLYDVPLSFFYDRLLKNAPHPNLGGKTPRQAAQLIGTEGFRNLISRDTWVRYLERKIESEVSRGKNVVVSDLRFMEEYEMLARHRAVFVGVSRGDSEKHDHESEKHIPVLIARSMFAIRNDGSLEEFLKKSDEVASRIIDGAPTDADIDAMALAECERAMTLGLLG